MSHPHFGDLYLGDTRDDDAQVIDDQVQPASEPADPPIVLSDNGPLVEPIAPTRLISRRFLIDPLWATPTQILPSDLSRKEVRIRVTSPGSTATDGIALFCRTGSDGGNTSAIGQVLHDQVWPITTHTGSIDVKGVGSGSVYVDVWAVTR